MKEPKTIAIYYSEDSYQVLRYEEVDNLSMAVQQLFKNWDIVQLYQNPIGNVICIDGDGNRYPAYD